MSKEGKKKCSGSKLPSAEAKENIFWDEDRAVSRLVNGGDLINGVIHHQFPWQGMAETNSLLFWQGEEGALSLMINLNKHSNININVDC